MHVNDKLAVQIRAVSEITNFEGSWSQQKARFKPNQLCKAAPAQTQSLDIVQLQHPVL